MTERVLVTGAGGLLGSALVRTGLVEGRAHDELDITDLDAISDALDALRPAAVVNCAAQARVDLAETERAATWAVNATAPGQLARLCAERGVRLVHLSTDYVLSDAADLTEDMEPAPQGFYAESKLAGERMALAHGAAVVRVQWVYHPGHRCFQTSALARMAAGEEVPVITDQVGIPTPAALLAPALLAVARAEPGGLFHLACRGEATAWQWIEAAARLADVPFRARPVTRAKLGLAGRPARSCLDSRRIERVLGIALPHWRDALAGVLAG